ncbi:porin [Muricoccus radiodurans]|uniref:porin n=1 Tax=Muricoccus radiodurans TaxID=2231721 RepID=UPI003CF2E876
MRKLLLGGTAIAAAALYAPTGALAQAADPFNTAGPPMLSHRLLEVRVGGYFRFYYTYTDQDFASVAGLSTGKSDFLNETEIHVVANGKAANGLRYGVALEIQNDSIAQTSTPTSGSGTPKTTLDLDEAWGFIAGSFGQLRFGDEDTVLGLMSTGHITNFATGALDGDFYDSLIAPLRPQLNQTSDPGDNTKIIYMSPQFFGFDAGVSFAFNQGESDREGCVTGPAGFSGSGINTSCDRLSAAPGGLLRRRNEITAMLRWRGSFGPVGLGAHVGYFGADAIKNTTGPSGDRLHMGLAGAQITAYGLTAGGWFQWGRANANFTPIANAGDDRNMSAYYLAASYTIDALTVGAAYGGVYSAGNQGATTGGRRDLGFNVGLTYRIAPGLEFVAEYTNIRRREGGFNFLTNAANSGLPGDTRGTNSRIEADVFLTGFRFAF